MNISRILLPVEFPNPSLPVLHQAAFLARHFRAQIVILNVLTGLSKAEGVPTSVSELTEWDMFADIIKSAEKRGDPSLAADLKDVVAKSIVQDGDPTREIVETALEEKADLIAMPSHGYGALYRFLLGSVTAKVLHDRPCPVWIGAHFEQPSAAPFAVRSVLCAVDFGPRSPQTLAEAAAFAASFAANLTLVFVTPSAESYGPGGKYIDTNWRDQLVNEATSHMAAFQRQAGTNFPARVENGDVCEGLATAAHATNADVLVVGCRPSGGRLRANGYAIIRESRIPVLSV